ncbi:MAG: phosphate propanoyltransferase [Bacillota bacterium]|nr:phosphate propanoyltransferase [Bacillota bacterium]
MENKILVEISARHVHLSERDLETLFGAGHKLTPKKYLSQPGQFASEEKVTVVGQKGELKFSVLGPVRSKTQVEVSLTEARNLGITVPVRESGDLAGSTGIKLVGPAGSIEISEGVIAAKRHIHLTPADAEKFGLKDKEEVCVKVDSERGVVFCNTVVRVSPSYAAAMHIDTDEANSAGLTGSINGEIVK